MKKIIYTIAFLICASQMSSLAYVDSQFMSSEQSLVNQGFSKEIARTINIHKKDPYAPLDENQDKRNIYEKFYNYINPTTGASIRFPFHDTDYDSSWKDL